jgi:hypothetical protein
MVGRCYTEFISFQDARSIIAGGFEMISRFLKNPSIVLPLIVVLVSGCSGSGVVVGDKCQWERMLYEKSMDFIASDTSLIRQYRYRGNILPIYVLDSAVYFGIDYADLGLDSIAAVKALAEVEGSNRIGRPVLCRSHSVFGLNGLSTSERSRYSIVFSPIDSAYISGGYLITCLVYANNSELVKLRDIIFAGDCVAYVFCYNNLGERAFFIKADAQE